MKTIAVLFLVFASTVVFSQNNITDNVILNKELTIVVKEGIGERDEYLLRKELKSSTDILEYVDINHSNKTVRIIALKDDISLYTSIFDRYFEKYMIKQNDEMIFQKTKK